MIHVVVKTGVEDDELFQILSIIEKGEEYFSHFLCFPLNCTHVQRPQCVERWNSSQLLEHCPHLMHLHFFLADADSFENFLLRQNPKKCLRVALTLRLLGILTDVELL